MIINNENDNEKRKLVKINRKNQKPLKVKLIIRQN